MNCQAITQTNVPTSVVAANSRSGICSVVRNALHAFGKYWTEGAVRAAHIETNARNAREEIFLKYGHLMMK